MHHIYWSLRFLKILVASSKKGVFSINKHVLSILVENSSGVLSKVSGLFSRRGYNIDSLTVATTDCPEISRITISVTKDNYILEQITKQLNKLVPVIKIIELDPSKSVFREIILVKIKPVKTDLSYINDIVNIYRGSIIDVSKETITVELTGDTDKIDAFLSVVEMYPIIELVRTGITGIQRGNKQL